MKNVCGLLCMSVVAMLAVGCEVPIVGGGDGGQNNGDASDGNTNDPGPDANSNGTTVDADSVAGTDASLAKFADPDSGFETTDVRDVDGEIMQFDTETNELVWQLDGSRIANWQVQGTSLLPNGGEFRVRFGTQDGERRAFFTEVSPPTICDLVVTNGSLSIFPTNVQVPQG